jgi:hypothetical protein
MLSAEWLSQRNSTSLAAVRAILRQEELKDQWLARSNISLSAVQRQEELKDR